MREEVHMNRRVNEIFPALEPYNSDPRVRRYLCPKRVVWTQGCVHDADHLLIPKTSQATLTTEADQVCVLENKGGENAAVLLDFGIEFNGSARIITWQIEGSGGNRADLSVRFGESAMEAMTPLGVQNTTNDHAIRDMTLNIGFLSAIETNETGYRFLRIELLTPDARLELKSIEGVFIYRDLPYIGSFSCSDPLLNRIFDTAAYTAHLNMQEYLWDGIKRDRLVWIGDMQTEVMTISSIFGYTDVVPKSLDLIRDETPIGTWMNTISSYSIWWLFLHYDWYQAFGNLEYLREQREYMMSLLRLLTTLIEDNGSEALTGFRFIDCPNQANEAATHCGLQGMMRMAMQKGEFLAELLEDSDTALLCHAAAEKLAKHIPDPAGSKQAGAFLVFAGLADAREMNEKLIAVNGAAGFSTFLGYYTLSAMAMAGDYQGALDAMRQYWGGMLKMGATTFWEDFNIDWMKNAAPIDALVPEGKIDIHGAYGAHCYVKFRHSLCHGWASGPVPYLMRNVLGIQILEAGCRKLAVRPHLADLDYARGTYPTPYGTVSVFASKQSNGTLHLEVDAPEGIEIVR